MIGSERTSAFLKSSSNAFEIALSALASPNWPTNTCGLAFWAAAVAASVASTRSSVTSSSPGISNVISAERPSFGELALVALGERGLDLVDALDGLEPRDGVLDGGGERGVADLDGALALDRGPAPPRSRGSWRRRSPCRRPWTRRCRSPRRRSSSGRRRLRGRPRSRRTRASRRSPSCDGRHSSAPRGRRGWCFALGSPSGESWGAKVSESFVPRRCGGMGEDWCPPVRTASPGSVRLPHAASCGRQRTMIRMMMMMSSVPSPMYMGCAYPRLARPRTLTVSQSAATESS